MAKNQWNAQSFPYVVDYCDHFETPREAYDDLVPIMQELQPTTSKKPKLRVYDPYYCNGRTAILLKELGFTAIHEKRDFYKDIKEGKVPEHDFLVTNPPYSEDHKKVSIQSFYAISCVTLCYRNILTSFNHCRNALTFALSNYEDRRRYPLLY